jgi:molybdate transport system permease protein
MGIEVWGPVLLSLQVSSSAVLLILVPAFLLVGITHGDSLFSALVDTVLQVPLVLPPVVVGYGLLWVLGPASVPGRILQSMFGSHLAFTFWAAVAAGAIVGLPFLVKSLQQSLDAMPEEALVAVYGLGWHPIVARFVVRSLYAAQGCARGALLAFSRSFGEFGATIIFASNIPGETRTVPLAIYTLSESLDTSGAAELLCGVSVVVAFGAVLVVRRWERRSKRFK